ncbi:MAG TPA: oligosaccharide flippase family protein [Thermoanaerobaculia bacterium]|nr:oligosaccharide flippase family protein [Thermoanaerobaculia bacterium]
MPDLWASIVSTTIARLYLLVVGLVSVTVTARWLGPTGQGIVAAATGWATAFASLGSLSLGQVALHRATERRGQEWLGDTLGTLIAIGISITAASWIVAGAVHVITRGDAFTHLSPRTLLLAFLLVPFLLWEQYGSSLLTATDRVSVYYRVQLIARTIAVLLMIAAWRLQLPVDAALLIALISQMLVAAGGMRQLFLHAGGKIRFTGEATRTLLLGGLKLHVHQLAAFVFSWLAVLMISHYRDPAQTGIYQFAASLINVMYVVPIAASMLLSARVAQDGADRAWDQQRKFVLLLPLLMGVLAAIAAVVAPFAIQIVAGAKYAPAVPLFRLLLFSVVGMTFATVMGPQWIGRGLFWQMSALALASATIHALLIFLWIPRYGMYGAAYATVVLSLLAFIGNGVLVFRCETRYRAREVSA